MSDDSTSEDEQTAAATTTVRTAGVPKSDHQAVLSPEDQAAVDKYNADVQQQKEACQNTKQQKIDQANQDIADLDGKIKSDKESIEDDKADIKDDKNDIKADKADIKDDKNDIKADKGDKAQLAEDNENLKEDQKQLAEDNENLKEDQKQLAQDNKQLATDQKKLNAAKRELAKAIKFDCSKTKHNSCVPTTSKGLLMTKEQSDALNAVNGTNIDFANVLNKAEGGSYANAYVPWWPDVQTDANGNPVPVVDKSDTVLGAKLGNGSRNNSGVTIGQGVDLGKKDKKAYFDALDTYNNKAKIFKDPKELQALKDKLSPYMGLTGAKACQALLAQRNNTNATDADKLQNLSNDELDLLNGQSIDEHVKAANNAYNKINKPDGNFTKLTESQQTVLFSEAYQGWVGPNSQFHTTAVQWGSGKTSYDPPGREHGWINQ